MEIKEKLKPRWPTKKSKLKHFWGRRKSKLTSAMPTEGSRKSKVPDGLRIEGRRKLKVPVAQRIDGSRMLKILDALRIESKRKSTVPDALQIDGRRKPKLPKSRIDNRQMSKVPDTPQIDDRPKSKAKASPQIDFDILLSDARKSVLRPSSNKPESTTSSLQGHSPMPMKRYVPLARRYEDRSYYYDEDTSYYQDLDSNKTTKEWFEDVRPRIMVKYIRLPQDHFKKTVKKKWYMRVLQNTEFWRPNAPIYLLLLGNRPVTSDLLKDGLVYELARETGGVIFAAEHRFYGKNDNMTDLKCLSSRQALADFFILLQQIRKEHQYGSSKVVIVGGGYGGSLAVWMKKIYPDVVDAVVSSSAPLLAKMEFQEYYVSLKRLYQNYMPAECQALAMNLYSELSTCLFDLDMSCLHRLASVCLDVDMTIRGNRRLFLESELSFFEKGAQLGLREMFRVCKRLKNNFTMRGDDVFWSKEKQCYDYNFGNFLKAKDGTFSYMKSWYYQQCNEFGFFQTSSALPEPFKLYLPLESMLSFCEMLFQRKFDEDTLSAAINRTNALYGGLKPRVTNVIFTHGDLDPWKNFGAVTSPFNHPSNKVIIIPMITHCRDLLPKYFTADTKALRKTKEVIKKFIKKALTSLGSVTDAA